MQRRHKIGELARIDANLAQSERLAAEAEAIEAEAVLLATEQTWRALTGMATPSTLAEERAETAREPMDDHPQLLAAAAAARTAQAKRRVAEETRRDAPELTLRVVHERESSSDPYSNVVGVKLTLPFSSGPRWRQENAAARAEATQADAELAQTRLRLQLDVEKAHREVAAAGRQLALARERQALAADSLRLAEKSYALGEADLTMLLRLRTGAYEADAVYQRQQVAQAAARSRLKQTLGVLP